MRFVKLHDGTEIPQLGQGTWNMGESKSKYESELESLRWGIDHGMTLIDTAEMYGDGAAEELLGNAIRPYNRNDLFLVSKVYPWNADRNKIFRSCEDSLNRLGTDHLDLYLLHWRGSVPLAETVQCMEELKQQGKILGWGVSNFDTADMKELLSVRNGDQCQTNQVLYHLGSRGVESASVHERTRHTDDGLLSSGTGRPSETKAAQQQCPADDRRSTWENGDADPACLHVAEG